MPGMAVRTGLFVSVATHPLSFGHPLLPPPEVDGAFRRIVRIRRAGAERARLARLALLPRVVDIGDVAAVILPRQADVEIDPFLGVLDGGARVRAVGEDEVLGAERRDREVAARLLQQHFELPPLPVALAARDMAQALDARGHIGAPPMVILERTY